MASSLAAWATTVLLLFRLANAAFDIGYGDDSDLFHFVTRPELKAPRFNVTIISPDEVTPGYWFIAPYIKIVPERFPESAVQPCQIGPAIYDGNGELIWSGACMVRNRNTCDFRAFTSEGKNYLSGILPWIQGDTGYAFIMDETMKIIRTYNTRPNIVPFNMHEFNVIEDGKRALHIIQKTELMDTTGVRAANKASGLAANMGIMEYDLQNNRDVFEYWLSDDVPLNHSNVPPKGLNGPYPSAWDWIHLNAVDKNGEGDYMITARYTDAIYKVSKDKKLLWTLGGRNSTFKLDGFELSGPHDGRFRGSKDGKEYISFLDNGGDEERLLAEKSTAYLLELDQSANPPVAKVVRSWLRPDGGRSDRRGNFQFLPSGNVFGGWSQNSYISEHTMDGRAVLEAQFASKRLVTYRAYKFNFTSNPAEDPVVKGVAYGESREEGVTVLYVSWNGATKARRWDFYDGETGEVIGRKEKRGFETVFTTLRKGVESVYVQAIGKNGAVLRRSATVPVKQPVEWSYNGNGGTVDDANTVEETDHVHEEL